MAATRSNTSHSSGILKFVFGFIFAFVVLFVGAFIYLRYGNPPVAVADTPFPEEKTIVHIPLNARIDRQMQQPPFGTSEDVFETGAMVYQTRCAFCHGDPGTPAIDAKWMYPTAPQLWKKHGKHDVVGVSDDEPGETYWKVKNGIRLTGMPSFEHTLTNDQMWDVTLLLKHANEQLPDPVTAMLKAK